MSTSPAPFEHTCPRCGTPTAAAAVLCPSCDGELTRIAAPPAGHSPYEAAPVQEVQEVQETTQATRLSSHQLESPTGPGVAPSSGPLAIGDRFGRYTIMRLLGVGGMGAVYQAWDKELDVVVALKVIRPEVLRDPAAEREIERRFKRELLLARQVTHKNVVRIHDLGEIDGIKYITMSYVHGTDLSTLVKREGPLAVPRILRIVRSVVSGLVAAHAAGVVHRDLKPANIMIDPDGEALIMDFGIARSTGGGTDVPLPQNVRGGKLETLHASKYTEATVLGSIVGTVEYMAPEQALGQPVDHRADVYACGLILYDLLTGKQRSQQPGTALEQLRIRMERGLAPIKSLAPGVPDPLAAIVMRASETDAAKRFQTTAELANALARLDDTGHLLPVKRTIGVKMMAAIVSAVIVLAAAAWWFFRPAGPEAPHAPEAVVIADFQNQTGEPTFDHLLEPMIKRALEGASFVTAYDRNGIKRNFGPVELPPMLDAALASEIAIKQGLGVVVSGSIAKQGSGYGLSMTASRAVTGKVIKAVKGRASNQGDVVKAATGLVAEVRKALGDTTTSESEQIFAMQSLSATSLDVVRLYAAGQEASSNNKFDEARQHLEQAIALDPNFGAGYLVLSGVARNQRKPDDAQKFIKSALQHLDGMTERERFTTRGMSYRLSGDYPNCVKEHADLIARYSADVIGHNQLALCASQLRDLSRARDEMRQVVNIVPHRSLFRFNLSIYATYASDFETGETEARAIEPQDVFSTLGIAFAQLGKGELDAARETFTSLAKPGQDGTPVFGARGVTLSASGLGDLAAYQGRFGEAARVLEIGAAADIAGGNTDGAASKLAELAYVRTRQGQKAAAMKAAEAALANSQAVKIRFLAGRTFIDANRLDKAGGLMADLAADPQAEPQAYAKILAAGIAMAGPDARPAIKLLTDANALLDTWIGHFELGRAYLAADQYPQADSEFDRCLKRRGEALALFLDEEPTSAYLPAVYYYQGRVREALNTAGFAESYRTYLSIREKAGEDPLLADVKKRIK